MLKKKRNKRSKAGRKAKYLEEILESLEEKGIVLSSKKELLARLETQRIKGLQEDKRAVISTVEVILQEIEHYYDPNKGLAVFSLAVCPSENVKNSCMTFFQKELGWQVIFTTNGPTNYGCYVVVM